MFALAWSERQSQAPPIGLRNSSRWIGRRSAKASLVRPVRRCCAGGPAGFLAPPPGTFRWGPCSRRRLRAERNKTAARCDWLMGLTFVICQPRLTHQPTKGTFPPASSTLDFSAPIREETPRCFGGGGRPESESLKPHGRVCRFCVIGQKRPAPAMLPCAKQPQKAGRAPPRRPSAWPRLALQ